MGPIGSLKMSENAEIDRLAPKSTLISLCPFEIDEFKPGLSPGKFHVDACKDGRPVCTIIGDSQYFVWIDETRGSLRVVDPSFKVAKSIVHDYLNSQLASKVGCHPAFMWHYGEYDTYRAEKELGQLLQVARDYQNTWFVELVRMADDDWERTRQHAAISDTQREALRIIDPTNSRNRPWVMQLDDEKLEPIRTEICPACGSDIPQGVIICRYCHFILDNARYEKMSFANKMGVK